MKSSMASPLIKRIAILWILLIPATNTHSFEEDVAMFVMEQVPYGFQTEDGKNSGVLLNILQQIRLDSGIGLTVKTLPLKRLLATLLRDKKTCTLVADSPVIVDNLDLLEPIGFTLTAGILPVAGVKLKDYTSLKGKLIAVALGIQFDEKFDSDSSLNKVSTAQYIDAINLMKANRVDAVAGAISVLKYIALQGGLTAQFFDQPLVLIKREMYLVCSFKLTKNERRELQQAVIKLRMSGRTQQIIDAYFGQSNQ
ncbi:MAG: hypothetical protein OFPI_08230 [Osedax symbiont Rs2]|nr:MAG: hypothetical protein OFPI_08230 [Osedax symbiont Rs2]